MMPVTGIPMHDAMQETSGTDEAEMHACSQTLQLISDGPPVNLGTKHG